MYVGERVVATKHVGVELDYACPGCGFSSKAYSIGRGQGHGRNPFFMDTGGEERAAEEAHYAAHRSAREAVRLVRCPRCGDRDSAAWSWFRIKAAFKLLCVLVPCAGASVVFFAKHSSVGGWIFLGLTPLLTFAVYWWGIRWHSKTVEARVLFNPPRLKHRRRNEPTAGAWFAS